MLLDSGKVPGRGERVQTVAKMADARKDDFLRVRNWSEMRLPRSGGRTKEGEDRRVVSIKGSRKEPRDRKL